MLAPTPAIGTPIPHRFHFVWFGKNFPRSNRLAIESCIRCCPDAEVILWHSDDLSACADFRFLRGSGLVARRLDADIAFGSESSAPFDVARLKHIWHSVASHVTRSNLARTILLYRHGGIYLDTDVLVIRDFEAYRQYQAFVGSERVVWPAWACRGLSVQRVIKSPLLDLLRKLSARLQNADWLIRSTAAWYPTAVNGAVLGARPGHPFLAELLQRTSLVPEAKWPLKHRLGTHVLQDTVRAYRGSDLQILAPESFYPLGPEISRQYFLPRSNPAHVARRLLTPDTRAVHWYASVTDLAAFSDAQWSELAKRTIYGHLCARYLAPSAAT
jgi:Glycosyltransferase sugar-binding region containing DXD motif